MPNNKDMQKGGSSSSMSNKSDREFESQGNDSSYTGSRKSGKQSAGSGKGTGSQMHNDEDDMKTSGGRKGNFSDKNRDSESQWSPGSSQSSDR
jgi:hypothetical protein